MSSTPLTSVEKVVARLEGGVADGVEAMIEEYIEDASDQARHYGNPAWSSVSCPDPVRRIVAMAVARFIRNPDAFAQSRAGDETLGWQELPSDFVGTVYFTESEIERLQRFGAAYVPAFGTMKMNAYTTRQGSPPRWGPVTHWGTDWGRPFPLFGGGLQ